jgi:flagellar protein FlbT
MSSLVLELRAGEVIIVNGAPIRFRNRASIELTAHARFVFGKQVMSPEAANTPARRLYLALQTAYVGIAEERAPALTTARTLAAALRDRSTSRFMRAALDRALAAAEADDGFAALRVARAIIQHEEAEFDRARWRIEDRGTTSGQDSSPGTNLATLSRSGDGVPSGRTATLD